MNRQIRLSRVHALNWYGYEDSLPVNGNVLLAGVTGSGKSVLMDLVQVVLLGPGRARYNLAATQEKTRKPGRTLKGYCLGDTKEESEGTEQFMRDASITFVALEFRWPGDQRVETWGFRIEFGSTADVQPRNQTPFFFPASVARSAWLDDKDKPLTLAAFESLVKTLDGKCFDTVEEYREIMAGHSRLNFDRGVLDRLLPMAMSFNIRGSFNNFCRDHILPSETIRVESIVSSFRTFQQYERDLHELHAQQKRLDEIHEIYGQHFRASQALIVTDYLAHEFRVECARDAQSDKQRVLDELNAKIDAERSELTGVELRIAHLGQKRDQQLGLIGQAPGGALYLHLERENKEILTQISTLESTQTFSETSLNDRLATARNWVLELRESGLAIDGNSLWVLEKAIRRAEKHAEGGSLANALGDLEAIREKAEEAHRSLIEAAEPLQQRLLDVRRLLDRLKAEIGRLTHGRMPFRTLLLDAINEALVRSGRHPSAQHLRGLCEVVDEAWRPALEVVLAQKFAVIVPPADYTKAEEVFLTLKASDLGEHVGRESLVRTERGIGPDPGARPHSLATKLSCEDPLAQTLVNQLLGDVICVDHPKQLQANAEAALADGFVVSTSLAERRRFYDGNPFIGKGGIAQQLAAKKQLQSELQNEVEHDAPLAQVAEDLRNRFARTFDLDRALVEALGAAKVLQDLRGRHENNEASLKSLRSGTLDELRSILGEIEGQLSTAQSDQRRLLGNNRVSQQQQAESALSEAKQTLMTATARFSQVKLAPEILQHLSFLEEVRREIKLAFPSPGLALGECERRNRAVSPRPEEIWVKLALSRQSLANAFARYQDLDPEAKSNAEYEAHRKRISDAEIETYKGRSSEARKKWEKLFRGQVLEKMRAALTEVENLLGVLTTFLKRPIGNSVYKIRYWQNPEFDIYRTMLDASSWAVEGELFADPAEKSLRETVERFLKMLTDAPTGEETRQLLDYRNYYCYDMLVQEMTPGSRPISVDRQADKFSGGENQTPYFIAILASYLHAYRRHGKRRDPTLALVPIDEAFSKLSGERIQDCINALRSQELQGIFSMSTGNIPYAYRLCDQLVVVSKQESHDGARPRIRNMPAVLIRGSDEERQWLESVGNIE